MFYRDVLPDFAGIVAASEETSFYRASLAMFFAITRYSWSLYLPFDRSERKIAAPLQFLRSTAVEEPVPAEDGEFGNVSFDAFAHVIGLHAEHDPFSVYVPLVIG